MNDTLRPPWRRYGTCVDGFWDLACKEQRDERPRASPCCAQVFHGVFRPCLEHCLSPPAALLARRWPLPLLSRCRSTTRPPSPSRPPPEPSAPYVWFAPPTRPARVRASRPRSRGPLAGAVPPLGACRSACLLGRATLTQQGDYVPALCDPRIVTGGRALEGAVWRKGCCRWREDPRR